MKDTGLETLFCIYPKNGCQIFTEINSGLFWVHHRRMQKLQSHERWHLVISFATLIFLPSIFIEKYVILMVLMPFILADVLDNLITF